jgi:hypothetical protein
MGGMNYLIKLIKYKLPFILLIFLCILPWTYNSIELDGPKGTIAKVFFPHNTIYSSTYSNKRFISVKVGDTYSDVKQKLGLPLDIYNVDGNLIGMRWSKPKYDYSYCVRVLLFNRDTIVIRKKSEFYID